MSYLTEGMEYKALTGLVKPLIMIDAFESKMGEDADIIVLSFYVRDDKASKDLSNWFESGYQEVLDSDTSPGELKPNRYLVYVELRRRTNVPKIVNMLLGDLDSLTEFEPKDWQMKYEGKTVPFSLDNFSKLVPLSPEAYRESHEEDLNEMRRAAGLDEKAIYDDYSPEVKAMQAIAGLR